MPTVEQFDAMLGQLPEQAIFDTSGQTIQLQRDVSRALYGLQDSIFGSIYGDPRRINPEEVMGNLGTWQTSMANYLGTAGDVETTDPVMGPYYTSWLRGMSANEAPMKTSILEVFTYMDGRSAYELASANRAAQAAAARAGATGAFRESLADAIGRLGNGDQ